MRLFVAIELGDAARAAVADEQRRLKAAIDAGSRSTLKWIAPAHMHLTLAFLGEVDEARVEPIVEAMRQPIDVAAFALVLGGLGVFPPAGPPRVLWVGVTAGADAAIEVQRRVAGRLALQGIAPETRTFHPHLTLARWRASRNDDRWRILIADRHAPIAQVRVDAVALIESRLSSTGPAHTALCHSRLGESAVPPLQSSSS